MYMINMIGRLIWFFTFYCSTYFHSVKPDVKVLRLNNLKSLRQHGGQDRALLSFDIQAGKNFI